MKHDLSTKSLTASGASTEQATQLLSALGALPPGTTAAEAWSRLTATALTRSTPFEVHWTIYDALFANRADDEAPPAAWTPDTGEIARSNITSFCRQWGLDGYEALYRWSVDDRPAFWKALVDTLQIRFKTAPADIVDLNKGVAAPKWLVGSQLNIADSCFEAPADQIAVIYQRESGHMQTMSYEQLDRASNRFANAVAHGGFERGDTIAIAMPMTVEAVIAYLGTVKAGCAVVSIADSFSAEEIATRLRIAGAKAVVTQDVILRAGKTLPMYQRVVDAGADRAIVAPATDSLHVTLREADHEWETFLADDDDFESVSCDPTDTINILFSSGTTGDPKAIPWDHTTPIKCAMDGFFHQDIKPKDVVAWPTNIGWMMGPWLVFASLINGGTMALYYGAPGTREFCHFVQDAKVQMLGVVPSLVKAWRAGGLVDGLDWSSIKLFSSTGEASNAEDYLYLMSLAGYRPVVEYCGGTEIGGGYISGTLVQPASPATFSTPSLGLSFYLLDESGSPADAGELYLVPPSIGLSTRLLNRDHDEVYYQDAPKGPNGEVLRRHGDQMERLPGDYYRAQGRADDTMNLSGIKVSSAEIERAVGSVDDVVETAAIAVSPAGGGPSQLVIYTVLRPGADVDVAALRARMQRAVSTTLNPLFKIYDVVPIDALPRTASNKVMRRVLRDRYTSR